MTYREFNDGDEEQPTLFEYGIQNEVSDIRAHVSVVNETIYVFQTKHGRAAIEREHPPVRNAHQHGIAGRTATGWIVPVEAIEDLRRVRVPSWDWTQFRPDLSTSEKGDLAVRCVTDAMKRGLFPIWFDATEDQRRYVQQQGTDLLVYCCKRVQVKCDYGAGDRPLGTGNVFLQQAERNPLRRI